MDRACAFDRRCGQGWRAGIPGWPAASAGPSYREMECDRPRIGRIAATPGTGAMVFSFGIEPPHTSAPFQRSAVCWQAFHSGRGPRGPSGGRGRHQGATTSQRREALQRRNCGSCIQGCLSEWGVEAVRQRLRGVPAWWWVCCMQWPLWL